MHNTTASAINGHGPNSSAPPVHPSVNGVSRDEWPACMNCLQSATNVYNGKHACSRCGWVRGQAFGR